MIETDRRIMIGWAVLILLAAGLWPSHGTWSAFDQHVRFAALTSKNVIADNSAVQAPVRVNRIGGPADDHVYHSPVAVKLCGMLLQLGERGYGLSIALLVVAFSLLLSLRIAAQIWLLVPLTFCALVPGPLSIAFLLVIPSVMVLFSSNRPHPLIWLLAGFALGLAPIFEFRATILFGVLFIYAAYRWSPNVTPLFLAGGALGLGLSYMADPILTAHWSLPELEWLAARGYHVLLAMDKNAIVGHGLLFLLLFAMWSAHHADLTARRNWERAAFVSVGVWAIWISIRLWSAENPFIFWQRSNSILIWCPWVVALLLAPFKRRPAFVAGFIAILGCTIFTDAGDDVLAAGAPWILAAPLLAFDFESAIGRGTAVRKIGRIAMILQLLGLLVLLWARADETSDHCKIQSAHFVSPTVLSPQSIALEFAPTAATRELYIAETPLMLFDLIQQFQLEGRDTFSLCLRADDSLYVQLFPGGKFVRPASMTVSRGGSLYTTYRRSYKLVIQKNEFLWMTPLDQVLLEGESPAEIQDRAQGPEG